MMSKDDVIIVNEQDEWLGTMKKLQAHTAGVLHRAVSVFVLNDKNELLLQQRAQDKYHSGGLWSNTCCSHPMPDESTLTAAHRRLQEEMGFDCPLEAGFNLRYKADVGTGLTENEYDHIYTGYYNGSINMNPEEVKAYKYMSIDTLEKDMKAAPALYTPWLHLALPEFITYLAKQKMIRK
jgi:isopentenyl-diphosphate delta-isomerase